MLKGLCVQSFQAYAFVHSSRIIITRKVHWVAGATYQFRIAAVYSNHDNKISPVSDRLTLKTGPPARSPITSPMIVDLRANVSSFVVVWQVNESFIDA